MVKQTRFAASLVTGARSAADRAGCTIRVVVLERRALPVRNDLRNDRINVEARHGIVLKAINVG
jgi:hypothetical protein